MHTVGAKTSCWPKMLHQLPLYHDVKKDLSMRRYPRFWERQGKHIRYTSSCGGSNKQQTTQQQPTTKTTNNQNQWPKQPTTKINAQNKHTTPTPVIPCEVSCSETRWIPYYGGSDREGSCWQLGDPRCRQDWSYPNPTNCGETLASWLTPKSRLHHPNRKHVSSVPHVWKVLLLFC